MLSSILEQKQHDMDILISCSYLKDETDGLISNLKIIEYFQKLGLNIVGYEYEPSKFMDRSYFRNDRTKHTKSDWILFADADMVYDDEFFFDISKKLKIPIYANSNKVLGADRHSLDIEFCEQYIKSQKYNMEPIFLSHPCKILKEFPLRDKPGGGGRAPGYFQLVNGEVARSLGKYCTKHNGFFADKAIRRMLGGVIKIEDTRPQYHLNHYRDNRYNKDQK
jgi:hypothetical protein